MKNSRALQALWCWMRLLHLFHSPEAKMGLFLRSSFLKEDISQTAFIVQSIHILHKRVCVLSGNLAGWITSRPDCRSVSSSSPCFWKVSMWQVAFVLHADDPCTLLSFLFCITSRTGNEKIGKKRDKLNMFSFSNSIFVKAENLNLKLSVLK